MTDGESGASRNEKHQPSAEKTNDSELKQATMAPGWSSIQAHIHAPRRSHEQSSRSSMSSELDEVHRRSSSDATPRPTPAIQDIASVPESSSRCLAFLADKLSSSALLHPHHRTDSPAQTPNSSSMTSSTPKPHASPAKVCSAFLSSLFKLCNLTSQ